MTVSIQIHKGKQYIFADYRGLKTTRDMLQVLNELALQLDLALRPSLIFNNYEGSSISTEYMNQVKRLGKKYGEAGKIKKSASIGIDGLKSILFDGYLRFTNDKNTQAFKSETEALDWLVS